MGNLWHYARAGQEAGPVPWEQLQQMAATGALQPADLVWSDGMPQWIAAGSVPALFPVAPAPGYLPPGVAPLAYATPTATYAGFWLRFVAAIADGLLLMIINLPIGFCIGFGWSLGMGSSPESRASMFLVVRLVSVLISWLYFALQESGPQQATPGKSMLGIQVTDLNGQRITFARATGRHFGKIISAMILLIGYIMAGFTERKQALHDIMAGCLVIKSGRFRVA